MSFFKKIFSKEKKETLEKGLEKTKTSFLTKLSKAVAGKSKVDACPLGKDSMRLRDFTNGLAQRRDIRFKREPTQQ